VLQNCDNLCLKCAPHTWTQAHRLRHWLIAASTIRHAASLSTQQFWSKNLSSVYIQCTVEYLNYKFIQ